eukprot:8938519-Pyramimonas_sp.AAC.1
MVSAARDTRGRPPRRHLQATRSSLAAQQPVSQDDPAQLVMHYADVVQVPADVPDVPYDLETMLRIRYIEFLPSPVCQHLEQFVGLALTPGTRLDPKSAHLARNLLRYDISTAQRHLEVLAHDSSMHPVTASRHRTLLAQICWDLDVSSRLSFDRALIRSPQFSALHLCEVDMYDETPMPV